MISVNESAGGAGPGRKSLYRSGFFVALVSLLSKGLGYLRELVLAYYFGTGAVVDAFRIALTAVLLPVNVIAGSGLQNSFIPVFQTHIAKNRKRLAWLFANQLFFILIVLGLAIFVLEYFFAERWVYLLAPGFNAVQAGHAVFFTRIMSFSVPLMMACGVAFVLNCFYIFRVPSLRPVVQNLFLLAGVLLTAYRDRFVFMGIMFPIAYVVYFAMLAGSLRKYWKFRFSSGIKRALAVWAEFIPVWLPLLGMVLVAQLNVYVDRVIGSLLAEGSVAALEYSRFLVETPGITIGMGFMSVFLPYFSELSARDDTARLRRDVEQMLILSVYIMIPLSLVLLICSEEVIRLVYGYGKFGGASVGLTAGALKGYSIGIWASFLYIPVSKYYQAVKRNVLLLVCFTISLAVNLALNLMLYKRYGIWGIALATSISQILLFAILFYFMDLIDRRRIAGIILFMGASAAVSGLAAWRVMLLFDNHIARTAAVVAVVAASWLLLNLGISEIRERIFALSRVFRRGGRGDGSK
ncbi:MAG: hypothetical protein EHM12_09410, partial [Dehalococcoidia bacterium]